MAWVRAGAGMAAAERAAMPVAARWVAWWAAVDWAVEGAVAAMAAGPVAAAEMRAGRRVVKAAALVAVRAA